MDYDPFYSLPFVQNRDLSYVPPGQYAGGGGHGTPGLFDIAGSNAYRAPFNPPAWSPNLSPLAGTPLGQPQSLLGFAANMAGNYYIGSQLQANGLFAMGNTGSYAQALRLREQQQQVAATNLNLRNIESDTIFRQLQGAAALTGFMGSMDTAQAEAIRGKADLIANAMPMLQAQPQTQWLATMLTGSRGSVYSLAAPVMDANRFQRDPLTGRTGFSAESNERIIRDMYADLFKSDSVALRAGLRTEDYGAAYRALSAEGLVGARGSLRDRTISAARSVMSDTGMDLNQLLSTGGGLPTAETDIARLPAEQLQSLRNSSAVQQQLRKTDTTQITEQLRGYGESLAAIKEIFTENGVDASVPKLINALKALTNNQLGRFSPAELRSMTRNLQAMSQLSGQNIDEVYASHQSAMDTANRMLGVAGGKAAQYITEAQIAAGMRFGEQNDMVGPYARDRKYMEALAGDYYARTLKSETANVMGVARRLEEGDVKLTDTVEGRRMGAALEAARSGRMDYSYTDAEGKTRQARTPTRHSEFMSLTNGAFKDVTYDQVGQMLSQFDANRFAVLGDERSRDAAFKLTSEAMRREEFIPRLAGVLNASAFAGTFGADPAKRNRMMQIAADALSSSLMDVSAVPDAMLEDPKRLNPYLVQQAAAAFAREGITLTDEQRRLLPSLVLNAKEGGNDIYRNMGIGSLNEGRRITYENTQSSREAISVRSMINEALSPIGKTSGVDVLTRLSGAIEKASAMGSEANFNQLLADVFSADVDLIPAAKEVNTQRQLLVGLEAQLRDARTPEEQRKISERARIEARKLHEQTTALAEQARTRGSLRSLQGTENVSDGKITQAGLSDARISAYDLLVLSTGQTAPTSERLEERAARMEGAASVDELTARITALGDPAEQDKLRSRLAAAAAEQLTVQGQLAAAGEFTSADARVFSRETLKANLRPDSALRGMLEKDPNGKWETISQDYLNLRTLQMFGMSPEDLATERGRRAAATDAAMKTSGLTVGAEIENVNSFLKDTQGLLASKQGLPNTQDIRNQIASGQANSQALADMAKKYFGGSVPRMLLSQGVGVTDEGQAQLQKDLAAMSPGQREDLIRQLAGAGISVSAGDLTADHLGAKVVMDMRKHLTALNSAVTKTQTGLSSIPGLVSEQADGFSLRSMVAPVIRGLLGSDTEGFLSSQLQSAKEGATNLMDKTLFQIRRPAAEPGTVTIDPDASASASKQPSEMKLTGTVEVRGDLVAQMTFANTQVVKS